MLQLSDCDYSCGSPLDLVQEVCILLMLEALELGQSVPEVSLYSGQSFQVPLSILAGVTSGAAAVVVLHCFPFWVAALWGVQQFLQHLNVGFLIGLININLACCSIVNQMACHIHSLRPVLCFCVWRNYWLDCWNHVWEFPISWSPFQAYDKCWHISTASQHT